jgi:hypothetical protein
VRCYHYTFSSSLWLAYPLPYHALKGFNFHFVIYISPQHNNSKDLYQSIPEQDLLMLRKSQNTFVAFHSTPSLHPSRFRFIQTPHCAIQLGFRNSEVTILKTRLCLQLTCILTSGLLSVSFPSATVFGHCNPELFVNSPLTANLSSLSKTLSTDPTTKQKHNVRIHTSQVTPFASGDQPH